MILIGLRFAVKTHGAYSSGSQDGSRLEGFHKNLMTSAVAVSGLGVLVWMVPNFLLGWFYGPNYVGYGSGGYGSYFGIAGTLNSHWYLIVIMVVFGSVTSFLGVYLVLRMRWSRFPEALKVQNFRRLMIVTWALWSANILVGYLIFYFYVIAGSG